MADEPAEIERVVDLDAAGDELPALIEDAARRGERLLVERGGVRLAVLVPMFEMAESNPSDDERDRHVVAAFRPGFSDLTHHEIQRESVRAMAEVRAGANPVSDDEPRPCSPPCGRISPTNRTKISSARRRRRWQDLPEPSDLGTVGPSGVLEWTLWLEAGEAGGG